MPAGVGALAAARPQPATGKSWYKIRNAEGADGDEATVYIYDTVGMWGISARQFARALEDITASKIHLRVNSPGGSVFDGTAIYNTLLDHPAQVRTTVDGLAASAASYIAQAGENIVMNRASQMMIHDAWGLCIGNAKDMRDWAAVLDTISGEIAGIYAARAGGKIEEWRTAMLDETWYTAAEAVTAGLADQVATTRRRGEDEDPDEPEPDEDDGDEPEDRSAAGWDMSLFRYPSRAAAPPPRTLVAGEASRNDIQTGGLDPAAVREVLKGALR